VRRIRPGEQILPGKPHFDGLLNRLRGGLQHA
jgi:hypothetical protein